MEEGHPDHSGGILFQLKRTVFQYNNNIDVDTFCAKNLLEANRCDVIETHTDKLLLCFSSKLGMHLNMTRP